MTTTRGVVHIHSAPSALCPHIEWALGGVFGVPAELRWSPQPAERGSYRAETEWQGPTGSAARLASAMRRWERVRFEVTEEGTAATDGERYSYTPALGVFHAATNRAGDVLVHEEQLRTAMLAHRDPLEFRTAVNALLGTPWDAELDVFRAATAEDAAPVRWLHRVG